MSGGKQPVGEMGERGHADLLCPATEPRDAFLGPELLVCLGPKLRFVAFLGGSKRAVEVIHRSSLPDAIGTPIVRRVTPQAEAPGIASGPCIITTSSP